MNTNDLPALHRDPLVRERTIWAFRKTALAKLNDDANKADFPFCSILLMGKVPVESLIDSMLADDNIMEHQTFDLVIDSELANRAWIVFGLMAKAIKG